MIRKQRRRNPIRWIFRLSVAATALILGLFALGAVARQLAHASNTSLTRFDAIIVLGTSADRDGNPGPDQLARVTEAVHEYERGVAPRIIFTGAAVSNTFVEAHVMARAARAQGVPESAIYMEPRARDTVQNACFSVQIMKDHGWHSAEVISHASHLPRAGLIFSRLPVEWRTHAAPPMHPMSEADTRETAILESLKTTYYLVWTRQTESCVP